jgi:hypothetical protein
MRCPSPHGQQCVAVIGVLVHPHLQNVKMVLFGPIRSYSDAYSETTTKRGLS